MNAAAPVAPPGEAPNASPWKEVYALLRSESGVDFSNYKQGSARRRVLRQMRLRGARSIEDYLRRLQGSAEERRALFQEMLVPVTNFFRERSACTALERIVFPALLRHRKDGDPIRIWVPGCSSGEEAYSIAMLLIETLAKKQATFPIQIFATDVNDDALQKARAGVYPARIAENVSPGQLQKFFTRVDGDYRISSSVRHLCLFSHHNLGVDPPLGRMDLISCQNVLIYFGAALQRRVLDQFHFALAPSGFLLLGPSETVLTHDGLFAKADRGSKLFTKIPALTPFQPGFGKRGAETPLPTVRRRAAFQAATSPPLSGRGGRQGFRDTNSKLLTAMAEIQFAAEEREAVNEELQAANQELEARMGDLESVHQAILDSLSAQVAVLDPSGKIILVNKSWRRSAREHGCACIVNALPGSNYLQRCRNGANGEQIFEGTRAVLNGSRDSFSCAFPCDSGLGKLWFLFSVTHLAGRKGGVVLSRTDITEQREADAARAQLAAIVESSTSAITAASLNGILTSWNNGAERLYGYTSAEMIGHSIRRIVPRSRREELEHVLTRMRDGETVQTFETVRRAKDGRLIPVALTVSPIKDAHGAITGASGVASDVSERQKLEAEVLGASEREQRRIAQDLHDGLGQQIAGIACLANVLQQQLLSDRSGHLATATKITRLLNDAAAQARSLAHGLYPVPENPRGLMSALRALATRIAELFGVDCTFKCQRAVLVKDGRVANHLYRIAQEAVTNAVRHSQCRHIEIQLSANPARLVLGVRDDGVGMRPKRKRTGIGLRIMQYRANLIAGTLAVQHGAGGGTEIVCTVNRRGHEKSDDNVASSKLSQS